MVFGPIMGSSKLPLTIPRALHGSGVNGAWVGSWRGCLARSLLGGDVFPCVVICRRASLPLALAYGA
jgi:hypothetical protein